jgi:LisH-like dimerisation domain
MLAEHGPTRRLKTMPKYINRILYFFAWMEIDSSDIIRLIQQFLRENNLRSSLKALTKETGIHLDLIEQDLDLKASILEGKWYAQLKKGLGSESAC